MAHNLEIRNGKTSFAAVGEKAWHGLGTYVGKAMTAAEAIEFGGLDFHVEKRPVQIVGGGIIDNFVATVRTDTNDALGIVSNAYSVVQNKEAFEFFDTIVETGTALYQTAGVLGKGERIFITARLPKDFNVKGDQIENYLLLTAGHDGKSPIQCGFTPVRVVCNNTLTAALRGLDNKVTILHYNNAKEKLQMASKIMGISKTYTEGLNEAFNKMAKVKINDAQLRNYIEQVMKPRRETINKDTLEAEFSTRFVNIVDGIMEFATSHDTQMTKAAKGTVWGAYNAISGYYGHIKNYGSADARMKDIVFKKGATIVEKAFDHALALV
jgi:phage/plasmid-like protein (TIGR03299 family)